MPLLACRVGVAIGIGIEYPFRVTNGRRHCEDRFRSRRRWNGRQRGPTSACGYARKLAILAPAVGSTDEEKHAEGVQHLQPSQNGWVSEQQNNTMLPEGEPQ